MAQYRVTADIRYLAGFLAGVEIPGGFRVTYSDLDAARRCSQWVHEKRDASDFVRASTTGNSYVFTSNACIVEG